MYVKVPAALASEMQQVVCSGHGLGRDVPYHVAVSRWPSVTLHVRLAALTDHIAIRIPEKSIIVKLNSI